MNYYNDYLSRSDAQLPIPGSEVAACLRDLFEDEVRKGVSPDMDMYMYLANRMPAHDVVFETLGGIACAGNDPKRLAYLAFFLAMYQTIHRQVDIGLLRSLCDVCRNYPLIKRMLPDGVVGAVANGYILTRDQDLRSILESPWCMGLEVHSIYTKNQFDAVRRLIE